MNILKQVCLIMFVPEDVCVGQDEKHEYKKQRGDNIKKMVLESTDG